MGYLIVLRERNKHDTLQRLIRKQTLCNNFALSSLHTLLGVLDSQQLGTQFALRALTALGLQPSLKPFFNFLYTVLKCCMEPLPVALLRMALRAQLYLQHLEPPPRPASFLSCLCQLERPLLLEIVTCCYVYPELEFLHPLLFSEKDNNPH